MANLYLIRRSLENYVGPFTLGELKEQYRQMEFGLQDEIAGGFGKWIALDNVSSLKKNYPEVGKFVQEELLGGWAVATGADKELISPERKRSRRTKRRVLPFGLGLMFLLILALMIAAVYFVRTGKLSSKFFDRARTGETDGLIKLIESNDLTTFDTTIETMLPKILPKMVRSRKTYNEWIPFVRFYAFRKDGNVEGLKPKLLRGMGQIDAPQDCSMSYWAQKWIDSSPHWDDFRQGKDTPSSDAEIILLWDPYWIKRRHLVEGWIKPINYYEGCLLMAQQALTNVLKEANNPDANTLGGELLQRLGAISKIIQGKTPTPADNPFGILGYMTCLEIAQSPSELSMCRYKDANVSAGIKKFLASYYGRNQIRLMLTGTTIVTDDNLAEMNRLQKILKSKDDFNSFNYQAETKFLLTILLNQGSIKESLKRIKYDFPEVDFEL